MSAMHQLQLAYAGAKDAELRTEKEDFEKAKESLTSLVASCEQSEFGRTIDSMKYNSSEKGKRRSATLTSSQSVASLKTTKVPTLDLSEVESGQLSSNR